MSHASMLRPTEEIADFFARAPSQQKLAAFRLSDAAQARARELLEKKRLRHPHPRRNRRA